MASLTHSIISERVTELDEQIARQDLVLKALREERNELLVALKVIKRFSSEADDISRSDESARKVTSEDISPKPAGAQNQSSERAIVRKTTPEMILDILSGRGAMNAKDLVIEVRKRYWPEAPASSVGPTAWRMWKDGRLTKGEDGYFLPNEKGPAVPAADPLERSEAGGNDSLF